MTYERILFEMVDDIAVVRLNDPEVLRTLSSNSSTSKHAFREKQVGARTPKRAQPPFSPSERPAS